MSNMRNDRAEPDNGATAHSHPRDGGDDKNGLKFAIGILYRHLWTFSSGRHGQLFVALSLLTAAELLQLLVPVLISTAINLLQQRQATGLLEAGKYMLLAFGTLAFSWLLHGPGRVLERNVAILVRKVFTRQLVNRALNAPLIWHDGQHSSDIAMRIAQSTRGLAEFAEHQYFYLRSIIMIVGPIVGLLILSPLVGVLAIAGYVMQGVIIVLFDRAIFYHLHRQNQAERNFVSVLTDIMIDVMSVFASRRAAAASSFIKSRLDDVFPPLRRQIMLNELKWATLDIISNLLWCGLIAVFVFQQAQHANGALMLGPIYIVYEYIHRANAVIIQFASQFSELARQNADFHARVSIAAAPQEAGVTQLAATKWRKLEVTDLHYRYGSADSRAAPLDGFTYCFERGRIYGLVGPSGCGKSTLFRILSGLAEPDGGTITCDGRAMSAAALRAEATLIPQRARLLEGTIADNLGFGNPIDPDIVRQTLMDVAPGNAAAFMAQGADTAVSEGGNTWSGGQRQRIVLARGMIAAAGSSLILLDEPTTSLDPESERETLSNFIRRFPDSCILVALHSHHLLDLVDDVVTLRGGGAVSRA